MIDVKEIMENKKTLKIERSRKWIIKPYCDATEAQARRKLLEDFKHDLAKARVQLQVNIQDKGRTMPLTTNEAYARLDDMFAAVNEVFDQLIKLEKQNVMEGE